VCSSDLTLAVSAAVQLAKLALGSPESALDLPVRTPKATPGAAILPGLLRRVIMPIANRLGA